MTRRLKVLWVKVRNDGFFIATKWLATTLYHRLVPQKQAIWCTDLTDVDSNGFSLPDNFSIKRCFTVADLAINELESLVENKTDLMGSAGNILLHERFKKGAVLWLLKDNERLAGYRWIFTNDHVNPTYVPHGEHDIHSIGLELLPDYRGRGLCRMFVKAVYIILKNEGFQRCYSEIYLYNKQSLYAMQSTGAQKIGIATRFNFFGKNIVIWHDMTNRLDTVPAYNRNCKINRI